MSVVLTVNGTPYNYPTTGDTEWGPEATDWAVAVTSGMLQKAGGLFQLLSEVDFGTSFGLKSLYYKTRTANPASAGQFRLARTDGIYWRNQANSADLILTVDTSNNLTYNGSILSAITVTDTDSIDLTYAASDLSADLNLSADTADSGFVLVQNSIESDGLKGQVELTDFPIADASTTGFLSNTDWSTFNGKQAAGNYITALTGDATATGPGSVALTLATVNGNVGSFGSSTSIPTFTVNAKGLITAASGNAVIAPAGTLTGTTLNATVVTSSLTSVGTIGTGTWQGTTVGVAYGGTGATSQTAYAVLCGGTTSTGPYQSIAGLGTTGYVLTSNGAGALPTFQVAAAPALAVTSQTTTYAIQNSDGLILVDATSGAFTVTLPTAVGITGKVFYLQRTDGTLANPVTIATTSAQTINGATTRFLATQFESWAIVSDGANWQVLQHFASTLWTAYTPTMTAFGTPSAVSFEWRRIGDTLEIQGTFTSGTPTGVEARVSLPSGLLTGGSSIPGARVIGGGAKSTTEAASFLMITDTSQAYLNYGIQSSGRAGTTKAQGDQLVSASGILRTFARTPITGWDP